MKNKNHLMMTGKYTIVSNEIARLVGNDAALLLAYLVRKKEDFKDRLVDGFFYNIAKDIEKGANLTRREYESSLEKIVKQGFVETKSEGEHFKKHFKINELVIENKIVEMTQTSKSTLYESDKALCTDCTTTNNTNTKYPINVASQHIANPSDLQNSNNLVKGKKLLVKKKPTVLLHKKELLKNGIKETLADNSAVRKEKEKAKLHREVSFDMQNVIDYWLTQDLPFHNEGTKTYAKAMDNLKDLLCGKLFNSFKDKSNHNRKYSIDEIKRSINNFVLAAYNIDYEPTNKKFLQKISFVDFFYNTYPCPREEDKSLFLKYLLSKPTLIKDSKIYTVKDIKPEATKILTLWYRKTFRNRDNNNYSLKNRNDLVYTVNEIKKFYEENKNRLHIESWKSTYGEHDPISFLALQLTRAMDKMLRENENMYLIFTTSWFKTEKTLQERLPTFLIKENMLK